MIQVEKTVLIKGNEKKVWDIISYTDGIFNYHPLVKKSPLLSKNQKGVGASRRCEMYDGTSVVETVLEWNEGESIKFELSEFKLPFESAHATMSIKRVDAQSSNVTIQMTYKMKFGFIGSIMGRFMIKPIMRMTFSKVLKSLNDHVKTGKLIGEKGVLLQNS